MELNRRAEDRAKAVNHPARSRARVPTNGRGARAARPGSFPYLEKPNAHHEAS